MQLGAGFRAVAEQLRVVSPEYEWNAFLKRNGGEIPERNPEGRWLLWLKTAKKIELPEERKLATQPVSEIHAEWREPDEWAAARAADPDRSIAIDACTNILAVLDKLGGTPTQLELLKRRDVVGPLCECGRLAANGPNTKCGECAGENQ